MAKINVIACNVKTSGEKNGKTWTLYEVDATKLDGEPIDLKLKSFDFLQGEVDVEFEKDDHPKYGVSYMLKPKGGGGGAPAPAPQARDVLHEQVHSLQQRVTALEGRLDAMQKPTTGAGSSDIPTAIEPAAPTVGADDDIPF